MKKNLNNNKQNNYKKNQLILNKKQTKILK